MKQKGIFYLTNTIFNEIKEHTFTTNNAFWFHRNLQQSIQEIKPQKKVNVRFDSDHEIVAWLQKHQSQYGWMYLPEEIRIKEKEQHFFPTVRDNNKIIGYTKVGINKVYIMDFGQIIPLPENTALIYDTFVLPSYRKLSIASYLITKTMDILRKSDFKHLWCHIPPWNRASIRLYTRMGFKKVSHVRFIRLLRWKILTRNLPKMLSEEFK